MKYKDHFLGESCLWMETPTRLSSFKREGVHRLASKTWLVILNELNLVEEAHFY